MKVKDYDFKYNMIEMIHSNLEGTKLGKIALLPIRVFMKDYGNMEVLSVQDFNDTKSTSVIIYNKDLD